MAKKAATYRIVRSTNRVDFITVRASAAAKDIGRIISEDTIRVVTQGLKWSHIAAASYGRDVAEEIQFVGEDGFGEVTRVYVEDEIGRLPTYTISKNP